MKWKLLAIPLLLTILVSCTAVDHAIKDAEASLNYGIILLSEGENSLAIIEFKKARDFYIEAGSTHSAFEVNDYIARAYYLNGNIDAAIETYFEAIDYAMNNPWGMRLEDMAAMMRELSSILKEEGRSEEAMFLLEDAFDFYRMAEDVNGMKEVLEEIEELKGRIESP